MRKTIKDAIIQILKDEQRSLSASELHEHIVKKKLYEFKAKDPINILKAELRKSCVGLNLKKSRAEKSFITDGNGKYSLLGIDIKYV